MAREYRHIQEYEKEIQKMRAEGKTLKEIGEYLGFSTKQLHDYFTRCNRKQKKIEAGITLKKKGRPRKGEGLPLSVLNQSKVNQLKYELAEKERRIKQLEMKNELMRDFLSLTGRKQC